MFDWVNAGRQNVVHDDRSSKVNKSYLTCLTDTRMFCNMLGFIGKIKVACWIFSTHVQSRLNVRGLHKNEHRWTEWISVQANANQPTAAFNMAEKRFFRPAVIIVPRWCTLIEARIAPNSSTRLAPHTSFTVWTPENTLKSVFGRTVW